MRQLKDLGLWDGNARILVLVPGGDLRAALAVLPVFSCMNLTFADEASLSPGPVFDLILAGAALERADDVNRMMAAIAALLAVRGQMVAHLTGKRFGKNSLQILLERYGFRLAARPLKWRILNGLHPRILARKL